MHAPSVIKNGSRTAIVVLALTQQVSVIEMSEGQLGIRTTNYADLASDGWGSFTYPVEQAADRYLRHHGGVSPDAERALRRILEAAQPEAPFEPVTKETQAMSIEENIARIADALERLAEASTAHTLLLEQLVASQGGAAAAAGEAVEKASAKGRGRGKTASAAQSSEATATGETQASDKKDAEPTASQQTETTDKESPTSTDGVKLESVKLETVQSKAAELAASKDRKRVLEIINKTGKSKISEVPADKLPELYNDLVAYEKEGAEESFL